MVIKKNLQDEEEKQMDAKDVVGLFTKSIPQSIETKNTSHGDDDFRETLLVDFGRENIRER